MELSWLDDLLELEPFDLFA